MSLTKLEN
jgi:hypothetical protein